MGDLKNDLGQKLRKFRKAVKDAVSAHKDNYRSSLQQQVSRGGNGYDGRLQGSLKRGGSSGFDSIDAVQSATRGARGCKQKLHTAPTPHAPLTTSTISEKWTCDVVEEFQNFEDRSRRLAVQYLRKSRWYKSLALWVQFLTALSLSGVIVILVVNEESQEWVAAFLAALALMFQAIDYNLQFADTSRMFFNASLQLNSMANGIRATLLKPFDERPDPYLLAIAVDRRIMDIINQAEGNPVELSTDIFTADPYD